MKPYLLITAVLLTSALAPSFAVEEKMGLELEWTFNTSDQFPGLTFGSGH